MRGAGFKVITTANFIERIDDLKHQKGSVEQLREYTAKARQRLARLDSDLTR
jgi:hypothetical protein